MFLRNKAGIRGVMWGFTVSRYLERLLINPAAQGDDRTDLRGKTVETDDPEAQGLAKYGVLAKNESFRQWLANIT